MEEEIDFLNLIDIISIVDCMTPAQRREYWRKKYPEAVAKLEKREAALKKYEEWKKRQSFKNPL